MRKWLCMVLVVALFFVCGNAQARNISPYESYSTGLMEVLVDYGARTDGQPVYVGYRLVGYEDDDEACIIYKLTYDESGNLLRKVSADGDNAPTKVWDDRASYTYTED